MEMTPEQQATAEAEAKANAEAEAKRQQDAEYWKSEAKKAFEDRDRAKEEARQLLSRPAAPVVTPQPEEDLNESYWKEPAKVMERLIQKHIEPFYDDKVETQKQLLLKDNPGAAKYFPQIDAMIKANPALKNKQGIVTQLVKVASAMEFDPEAERKRIEDKVRAEMTGKVITSVEGAGTASVMPSTSLPDLTAEEKRFAERFHRDLSPVEAHKKYAENKLRLEQRSI